MAKRMIQVGTGGFGGARCRNFLPPNVEDGLVEANLQSVALIFAAIMSSQTGWPQGVREVLAEAGHEAAAT